MATTDLPDADPDPEPAPRVHPAAGNRLVVVTPTFAPEPLGTPLYAADTVGWLASAGWDVEVVTAQPFYPQFERYDGYGRATRREVVDGVPILRLPTVVPRGGRARWCVVSDANFLAQGAVRAGVGVVRRAPTVLSISPGSPVAPIVGRAARGRRGRHVCLVHDVQSGLASGTGMVRSSRLVNVIRGAERRALDLADEILVLSDEMAGVLRAMGVSAPVDVLPLWSTITPPSSTVPIGPVTDVQFSGNFGRKQGLDQLLALLTGLRAARPGTTFTIRGAGQLRSAFQAQLDGAGLGIEVESPVEVAALPTALMSSRVHVVPQLPETAMHVVPSKIVNALAMGGAVIAFSSAGSPVARMAMRCDAIRVVAPGDTAGAVAAVSDLLDGQDQRRLRTAAMAYATEHHDREQLLGRLHEVLLGPSVHSSGEAALSGEHGTRWRARTA